MIRQRSLEDITIITSGKCLSGEEDTGEIDLSKFHALRRISWIGLQHDVDMLALSTALKTNSKHLTHLRLEYIGLPGKFGRDVDIDDEDTNTGNLETYLPNLFARKGLEMNRSAIPSKIMFPALTSLSLAFISLRDTEEALKHALNIHGLLHLTLRQCPAMEDFLRAITSSGQKLKLLSLEYNCGSYLDDDICEALQDIARLSPEITDLFISITGPIRTLEFWRTIADIRVPLTRFVYHVRSTNTDDESSRYGEEEDLTDLSLFIFSETEDELQQAGEQHPFAQMNLKCLGLGADSYTLVCRTHKSDVFRVLAYC